MNIAIGDEVRVHYHPPGQAMSFVEGIVSRIDVPTLRGQVFVIDVTYEVLLDREQRIRPGYQNYVLYQRWEEFPGRIEVLSNPAREPEPEVPSSLLPEPEPPEPTDHQEQFQVEVEHQEPTPRNNIITAIFRRQR